MSEITYIVKITAAEGKLDEALAVLGTLVDAADAEPGTLAYELHTDAGDPDVIWFYERYADKAAFDAHVSSAAMAEVMGRMGSLVAGPPDMRRVDLVRRKGESA
ncbi:MAG TPA: putative quinol monooxygenase [Acidimicrobiales bacterium]|nr:putative quinol monooxygenase [Acidimicrobiales bacterium]